MDRKTPGQGSEKPSSSANPKASPGDRPARTNTPSSRGDQKVLSKKSRIPDIKEILTSDRGKLALSENLRNHYVAIAESTQRVTIYCDYTKSLSPHLDNTYQKIHRDCERLGYKIVNRALATPNIISIIYSLEDKGSDKDRDTGNNKYVAEYHSLISRALDQDCTDIHIQVRRDTALLRFRINGDLVNIEDWDVATARRVSNLIYTVIASEKEVNFNEHEPQSAIVDDEIEDTTVRLRLNTLPAFPKGFDMNMRVLRMGMTVGDVSLESLGYTSYQIKDILSMKAKPNGVIIVAGVTGSGKSTTNTVLLSQIIEENTTELGCSKKVITVEDPTEYEIPGATQVTVIRSKTKTGANPFADTLRACVRMDPDILLVGEVRDSESAELMQQAIQTGHQVFTTIHAQGAFNVPARMNGMNLSNDVIGGHRFLSGLIYQSLVKICCPYCSYSLKEALGLKEFQNSQFMEMAERIKQLPNGKDGHDNVRIRRKDGCDKCNSGVVGRTVVAETVDVTNEISDLFRQGLFNEARMLHRENGGKFVVDHAIEKVLEGLVDPQDAESQVGPLIPSSSEIDNGFRPSDPTEEELNDVELVSDARAKHPITPISKLHPPKDAE